jgi:glycosyltransferase involved in cell wall biosynthesis
MPIAHTLAGTIDSAADRPDADRLRAADTVILVAAHNEADRIAQTLAALAEAFPDAAVWVADDGSSDATAELARAAGAQVLSCERVLGKGAAVTLAARRALERQPVGAPAQQDPVFLLCDGDLACSAARLGPLLQCVRSGEAELAVAVFANSVGGGLGIARGFARWAIERRCGLRTRAPISGQRALSRRALEAVLPLADGYGMEIGMTIDAARAGCRLQEVELELAHRATGRTLAGFAHRGGQLLDFVRVYVDRR